MSSPDLTVIFLTSNTVPEYWAAFHKKHLLDARQGYPLITVARKQLDFGDVNILDTGAKSATNYYVQLLAAAKIATTPFIGIAEDDTLYHKEHFSCYRPAMDVFAYNEHKWTLATWVPKVYSRNDNRAGAAGIYPREECIDALTERLSIIPPDAPLTWHYRKGEPGTGREDELGVKRRRSVGFKSETAIIQFDHEHFSNWTNNPNTVARRHKKRFGIVKAYDIPYWGKAEELVKNFR